jgi:2-polyprenyl-6-hydroxyphenyl methylase/3-demethylubiquinone-9 3-methyltransferase
MPDPTASTIDAAEIRKFERMAADWWAPEGKFRPLHRLNPARLAFVRDVAAAHFSRDAKSGRPLTSLGILDIGCGGGILSEPLARLGGTVVGIDPSEANIAAARHHAEASGLVIDYRATTAEALAEAGNVFDIVLAMEVVEHVADMPAFIRVAASLTKPGGLLFVATINRTAKAFALAILGAEYILRWLPRGTHDYARLVRPSELEAALDSAGLEMHESTGVRYDPLAGSWSRSADMDVNYMVAAGKPEAD